MTAVGPWTCPTCRRDVRTPYCPACGEKRLRERDLTLRGLLAQLFGALSNIDSRLLRSLRHLVSRPGTLTLAFARGSRMPYLGPVKLFLVANVLFFAMQSLTGTNVVGATLDSHLRDQDWSALAQRLVASHLEAKHTTIDRYAPVFDRATVLHAKSLIVVMVVPFALLLPPVFFRSRWPFAAHAVFSLHLYTFLLLLFCLSLAITGIDVALGGSGLRSPRMDNALSVVNLAACSVYLYAATGTAYRATGALRVVKALGLALAVAAILLGYRFVLLLVTLYLT